MKKILLIALIILASDLAMGQNYVWTQKANYGGVPIYDPFGFSIGTKGYVGGGRDITLTFHYDFWEWDQATNTWTQKANYAGTNVYGARGFSIGSKGYVVSGYGSSGFSNALWEYNPVTNAWNQKQSHPGTARYTGVAITIGNKAYFGTGSVFASNYQNDWYEYDPLLNAWTQKANFIGSPRQGASSFVIGNDGYVGMGGDQSIAVDNNDFCKYNALTNSWIQIASVPGPIRNAAFGFAINGYGFVTQGYYIAGTNDTVFKDFYKYYPATNSWCQLLNFPGPGHFEGVFFSIGSKAYIGLGSDTYDYSHYMNDFWEVSIAPSDFTFIIAPCQSSASFMTQIPNVLNYNWNFGDGGTSAIANPTYNYANNGTYNVQLIVLFPCGSDTINHSVTVNASQTPTAAFTFQTQPCSDSVTFINQSLNGMSYSWTFGDGGTSNLLNPTHVYTSNGAYNVQLIVSSPCGTDTIIQAVNINAGVMPTAAFTFQTQPCSDSVTFINQSLNGINYYWAFGDGGTSTLPNPIHVYATSGNFSVMIVASSTCGSDTISQALFISPNQPVNSAFSFQNQPCTNTVVFFNQSFNSTLYQWDFGDGTTSTDTNPSHTYSNIGNYQVSLIAGNLCSWDTLEQTVSIANNPHADFYFETNPCDSKVAFINRHYTD